MSVGQLYYFQSVLNKLPNEYQVEDLLNLDFPGKENTQLDPSQGIETLERQIRDVFSQNYSWYLQENDFKLAALWWDTITSPTFMEDLELPVEGFGSNLENWINSNTQLNKLPELINESAFSSDEDFSLSYGLEFIYKLSPNKDSGKDKKLDLEKSQDSEQVNMNSGLVVITSQAKAPLFLNLNATFLNQKEDPQEILNDIEAQLETNPDVQLILVDTENVQDETQLITFLTKRLPKDILISTINFNSQNNLGYFDKLVLDTLGIRLVD